MVWLLTGVELEGILNLKRFIPKPAKTALKNLYFGVMDLTDSSERKRDMLPPRRMRFVGDGDYKGTGFKFREMFIQYGGLKPEYSVLDVGCGIGRMAVPLTGYLRGEYRGFDIVKMGPDWCTKNVTPRFPNFQFNHADIRNSMYNPSGRFEASSYKFPYEDETFDFVFLTSVFTHMMPLDVENYLSEISRVMKKGGTCFITMFLLNDESKQLIAENKSSQQISHSLQGFSVKDPSEPEGTVGLDESYIRSLYPTKGLSIIDEIHFGSWCGRKDFLSYQDVVVARKI
ncbi:MAG TPA: class I SAM-dependent methyltransferase [Edaphobacter sp.]|nr:class I SAM-dependent methyltransferase [Edaphobacter sp.]